MRVGSAWKSQDTNSFSPAVISMKSSRSTPFQLVTCATYHTETASTSDLALNSQSIIGLTLSTATTATISVTPLNFSCASAHRCTVMLGMITPYTLLPECKNKWRIRIGSGRTRLRPYGIPYGGCGGIVGVGAGYGWTVTNSSFLTPLAKTLTNPVGVILKTMARLGSWPAAK